MIQEENKIQDQSGHSANNKHKHAYHRAATQI